MTISRRGSTYVKTAPDDTRRLTLEKLGIDWLAAAPGGAAVVDVLDHDEDRLVTRAIEPGRCEECGAYDFGAALARTHAAGADFFGQAPAGWCVEGDKASGWIGEAPLVFSSPTPPRTWGTFYAEDRVLPYLPHARNNGSIDASGARAVERLCERLRDGDFDSPQPSLVTAPASRTHGDLWSGNVIWEERDDASVGVLIDPAAHGAHAETDLAALSIFGQPHLDAIYHGYCSVSALESGWDERVALHQLHLVIVHAFLFGGGYGADVAAIADKYVK